MAPPEISGRKLVSFDDLEPRGIRFSRVHLRRLEARGLFPQHVTIGAGNFIGWFEHEINTWLDALAAARPKRAAPKTTTDNAEVTA
jgi:predicted DNA-binding transcriptional regulator AlpA